MPDASRPTAQGRARPSELERNLLRITSVPLMTLIIIAGSHIAIPTAPYGIPITLQTLGVLLCALALGPRLGFASVALYLVMGILGISVFGEGKAGLPVLLGQTGGYLLGFLFCQPIAHMIIRRDDGRIRGWLAIVIAGLAVHMTIFAFGVPWLHWIRGIDPEADPITWGNAVYYGFVVFIPGMLLKTGIATVIAVWALPSVSRTLW